VARAFRRAGKMSYNPRAELTFYLLSPLRIASTDDEYVFVLEPETIRALQFLR